MFGLCCCENKHFRSSVRWSQHKGKLQTLNWSLTHFDRGVCKYLDSSSVWISYLFASLHEVDLTLSQHNILQLLHCLCKARYIPQQGWNVLHLDDRALWTLRLGRGRQGPLPLTFCVDPWWESEPWRDTKTGHWAFKRGKVEGLKFCFFITYTFGKKKKKFSKLPKSHLDNYNPNSRQENLHFLKNMQGECSVLKAAEEFKSRSKVSQLINVS